MVRSSGQNDQSEDRQTGMLPSPKYKRSDYKPDDNADNNANDEFHVIPPK